MDPPRLARWGGIEVRVLEQADIALEWDDLDRWIQHPAPKIKRKSGVHVSGVLKYIAQELDILKADDKLDLMPMCIATGMAMEAWIVGLYTDLKWQPGQLTRGGVTGSPDADRIVNGRIRKCEMKATYKSIRTRQNILDEWMWIQQDMTYINMDPKQMLELTKYGNCLGEMHIWWVNGDYTHPYKPLYTRYLIEYSRGDLSNNWRMIQKYKHMAKKEEH